MLEVLIIKKDKYVEAAKGTNLFFAIYVDSGGNRNYETIPLNVVVERLKQGLKEVPEKKIVVDKGKEKDLKLLFFLSPNDLVYVPTEDDIESDTKLSAENLKPERIYKMISCTGKECHFIPGTIAAPIVKTTELGSNNKSERTWDGIMVKQHCMKIEVDRLGNAIKLK